MWNEHRHHLQQTREEALVALANRVGGSVEKLNQLPWEGINLINVLITAGNTEAAQHLANQPEDIGKVPRQLLIDTAAGSLRLAQNAGESTPTEWITMPRSAVDKSLRALCRDTDKWSARWISALQSLKI